MTAMIYDGPQVDRPTPCVPIAGAFPASWGIFVCLADGAVVRAFDWMLS